MTERIITLPDGLHPETVDLVIRFAAALGQKLYWAEQEYGYSSGWRDPLWERRCQYELIEHVEKGDPLDVGAYSAFMWHHGWATVPKIAKCIGCGCTDLRACEGNHGPCYWLAVDYPAGVGVCSECEAHLDKWRARDVKEAAT